MSIERHCKDASLATAHITKRPACWSSWSAMANGSGGEHLKWSLVRLVDLPREPRRYETMQLCKTVKFIVSDWNTSLRLAKKSIKGSGHLEKSSLSVELISHLNSADCHNWGYSNMRRQTLLTKGSLSLQINQNRYLFHQGKCTWGRAILIWALTDSLHKMSSSEIRSLSDWNRGMIQQMFIASCSALFNWSASTYSCLKSINCCQLGTHMVTYTDSHCWQYRSSTLQSQTPRYTAKELGSAMLSALL